MIRAKHSFGKKDFNIAEQFVDREEAKQLYREKLNSNKKQYNIVVYYGVGGIGKSKLRKEIARIHEEENCKGITFYLDFNAQENRNIGQGILKLADSCNTKIDFKCFEIAYALYFQKKNPDFQYGREKEMIVENSFVNIGLNILGLFDGGIFGTIAEIVERSINAISDRIIDEDVKEELKKFESYSIAEMEELLPLFFQYDLLSYLKKHSEAKILFIFDTFEALNEGVIEPVHRRKNERWVREIIEYFDSEHFPNLIITIFGREKIEWKDEWQNILVQYKLIEFNSKYSRQYLNEIGIFDKEISHAIISSSNGYPFLLYLSVETYANIINSGGVPTPEMFTGSYPEIVERFIYNLDKETVEVLRLMSIPNCYTEEIFVLLVSKFNIPFPVTEFDQFNKYSFVSYDYKDGSYRIHDLIRKEILGNTAGNVIKATHKILLDYYSNKIKEYTNIKYILEIFFHAVESMDCNDFKEWLNIPLENLNSLSPLKLVKKFQSNGEQSILMQLIERVINHYSLGELPVDLINVYIDTIHLGGNYCGAVEMCNQYLSHFSKIQVASNEELLKMQIRKIHHSMFFMPVRNLIAESEKLLEGLDIKQYPEQYNELLFLLGGNLGVLLGDLEMASKWLNLSMEYAEKNHFVTYVQRTIRKKADIMISNGNIDGAIQLLSQFVDSNTKINEIDTRYKIYLMGSLGEAYRKSGEYDLAWYCYDIVERKCIDNHLPGWQAHSYLAKGMIKFHRNNYNEASSFFDKALNIYNDIGQKWGIINTKLASCLMQQSANEACTYEINMLLKDAEAMNYSYNIKIAKKLLKSETPYFQLFFL